MQNYEVTFIVDPVLSGDEIKTTAQSYEDFIKNEGGKIVHMDEMGLRQLAYPINKRSSGIYYSVEFEIENGLIVSKIELSMRRDERIMRFLTVSLDKYGVKYNDDKRNGKIGKITKKEKVKKDDSRGRRPAPRPAKPAPAKPVPAVVEAPAPVEAPAVVAKSEEE